MVLALAMAAFVMNLNANVMGALLPFLMEPFSLDEDMMGWLLGSAAFASAAGALLVGPLSDRYGRAVPMHVGLLLFVVASAAHCFASTYEALLLVRALAGAAVGIAYANASALVAALIPYERRGAAMGAFSAGMFLAVPIGLPMAVLLADGGAWRSVFAVQGGLGVLALLLAVRLVPTDRGEGRWSMPWDVFADRSVVPALLAVMLYVGAFFTTVQLVGTWLHDTGILPRGQQVWMWASLGLCSALGSYALAPLADRMGKLNFVLLTTALLAVCLLLLSRVTGLGGLLAVGLPLALVAASRTGPLQALMSGLVPRRKLGNLMGLRAASMQLGIGAFAAVAGQLYDGMGFAAVLWAATAAVALSYALLRFGVEEGTA